MLQKIQAKMVEKKWWIVRVVGMVLFIFIARQIEFLCLLASWGWPIALGFVGFSFLILIGHGLSFLIYPPKFSDKVLNMTDWQAFRYEFRIEIFVFLFGVFWFLLCGGIVV